MKFVTLLIVLVLAGCISTARQLETQSEHRTTVKSDENYQAVYRRMLTQAKECLDLGGTFTASNKVDGQLYSDLGKAEISYYLDNVVDMYFAVVKIDRTGDGATVNISTGSQPAWANEKLLKELKGWAEGRTSC